MMQFDYTAFIFMSDCLYLNGDVYKYDDIIKAHILKIELENFKTKTIDTSYCLSIDTVYGNTRLSLKPTELIRARAICNLLQNEHKATIPIN